MKEMLVTITEDIVGFFCDYAETGAWIAAVAVVFYWCALFVWRICLHKVEPGIGRIVVSSGFFFLLVMYLYIVVGITVLSRSESQTRYAYFELFRTFQNTFQARKQIYENILLFMPYAVLLFGLGRFFRKGWRMCVIGFISSVAIESAQWLTQTGYFEVDDIWTNVLGMMIGYACCVLLGMIWGKIKGDSY